MNLHSIVGPVVNAVVPEISGTWRRSTGSTTDANYNRVPTYSNSTVRLRVQALTGKDLMLLEQLNIQGVERAVYMFGNGQGVVRTDEKGGDLLLFPQVKGGAVAEWLAVVVLETWTPDVPGWCKIGVKLQVTP